MPKVTFKDDDLTVEAAPDTNLRDLAQAEGASVPFGCEQGICGTCLSHVVSGAENISPVEDQETETLGAMGAEPGQRLLCQCRVQNGDIVVESAH
jgi:ferredoxin